METNNPIYLDNNATTRCDPRVVEKMLPFFTETYGNPANGYHLQGRIASRAIENAREEIAKLIGAHSYEIFFTSGATESNNLAIFGLAKIAKNSSRNHVITSKIEHKAVLLPCKQLLEDHFLADFLEVNDQGEVNPASVENALNRSTLLVTIHLANNEIGTIQPIKNLAEITHRVGAFLHTDAAQAIGKIPVDVNDLGVDLLSISAHKLYGPKGIGALYIRGGLKSIPITPIFHGGGQEKGLRSGTSNVPAIVGFGEAARLCAINLINEYKKIAHLRDEFEQELASLVPGLVINAKKANRLPNTSNITFPKVDADALLLNLTDVMLSTGSACNSGAMEPSHVLQALGLTREAAQRTIRASLGRFTTLEEIHSAVEKIVQTYKLLA